MSFVNCVKSGFEKTLGDGTAQNPLYPGYMYYDYGYFAHIYSKIEIGIGSPVWITGIKFQMVGDALDTKTSVNQTLKLGQVNVEVFDTNIKNSMIQQPFAGFDVSNLSTVKSNFIWSIPEDYNDWMEISFDTPFQYNPASNLLLMWENRDGSYLNSQTTPAAKCTANGQFRSYYDYQDNNMPPLEDYGTRDNTGRPNIQLIIKV